MFETAQEQAVSKREWAAIFEDVLSDASRHGAPDKFTPEHLLVIIVVAYELPKESGRTITHWTPCELAESRQARSSDQHFATDSVRTTGW